MFKDLDVDLLFTGELSHHEALAAKEKGISTIACESPLFFSLSWLFTNTRKASTQTPSGASSQR